MKKTFSYILILTILLSVFLQHLSINADNQNNQLLTEKEGFLDRLRNELPLVFNDEFDGNALDTTKWEVSKGWARTQAAYSYVDDKNIRVEDGKLILEARKASTSIQKNGSSKRIKYTSGEITTDGTAAWKNGLIEVRAKLPKGKGAFPAIWTMGYDYEVEDCNWPKSTEIDIMEATFTSDETRHNNSCFQTLHFYDENISGNGHGQENVSTYDGLPLGKTFNDDYHNFWVYFDNKYLIFGVDETMSRIIDLTKDKFRAYTDYEQFLILGMQMGDSAGEIELTKNSDFKMLVDYVRVYSSCDDETKYDNYLICEAESFESGNETTYIYEGLSGYGVKAVNMPLTSVINGLNPGSYDVYASIRTTNNGGVYTPSIAGIELDNLKFNCKNSYPSGINPYLGTIKVVDDKSFDIKLINQENTEIKVDKYIFVKTDKAPDVIITNENMHIKIDEILVNNESEFSKALKEICVGGTIKLENDINVSSAIQLTQDVTIDLNSYSIISDLSSETFQTVTTKTYTFKNGNMIFNGRNNSINRAIYITGGSTLIFKNTNVDINSNIMNGSNNSLFGYYYLQGAIITDSCTFNFKNLSTSLKNKLGIFAAEKMQFNNTKFIGNNNCNLINTSNLNKNVQLYFKNCSIQDFNTFLVCDSINNDAYPLRIAETAFKNCTQLVSNIDCIKKFYAFYHDESKKSVPIKAIDEKNNASYELSDFRDNKNNNTINTVNFKCLHLYTNATCTQASVCAGCGLSNGEPLGHNNIAITITEGDCNHDSIEIKKCSDCNTIISEQIIKKSSGHEYGIPEEHFTYAGEDGKPTCKSFKYYKKVCTKCGHYQCYSGTYGKPYNTEGHIIDTSKPVSLSETCGITKRIDFTCKLCGKPSYKTYRLSLHKLVVDNIIYKDESKTCGTINYKCSDADCTYTESEAFDKNSKFAIIDGVKFVAPEGEFYLPYNSENSFIAYKSGNELYEGGTWIHLTEDMTFETLSLNMRMLSGASIRYSHSYENSGIRFYTDINKDEVAELKKLGAEIHLGTIVTTKDLLGTDFLQHNMSNQYVEIPFTSENWFKQDGFCGVVGSIVDIESHNINREFIGRGYAKIKINDFEKIIYADYSNNFIDFNTRSISYIAYRLKNSEEYDMLLGYAKDYIDKIIANYYVEKIGKIN